MAKKQSMVDRNKIYAIRVPGAEKPIAIALYADPDYEGFKGICYLTPPLRGHMIEGKLGKETAQGFTFKPKAQKGVWEFIEVTYDNFLEEYHTLAEGSDEILAEVSNTQELQDWYHRNFPM